MSKRSDDPDVPTLSFYHPSLGTDGLNQLREVLIICFFCCLPLLIRLTKQSSEN
jgi:hypothetical protein